MTLPLRDRIRILFTGVVPEHSYVLPAELRGLLWLSLHDGEPGRLGEHEVQSIPRRATWLKAPSGPRARLDSAPVTFVVVTAATLTHWALWRPQETTALHTGYLAAREKFDHRGGKFDLTVTLTPGGGATWPVEGTP